ncbi:MAG TPA: hypothetical protein PKY77_10275 [Phycisphaerae bacterium]|nr:hypothetical protein [Phycisphaerae bacterium]HRY69964.1 hypothetical protein [Phycisphaerae bacterium]HSA27173.1 hypothetical protein [Phycisphaerae bacterium]
MPPADPQAWAEAINRAAQDPEPIRQMQTQTSFTRTVVEYTNTLQHIERGLLARSSTAG